MKSEALKILYALLKMIYVSMMEVEKMTSEAFQIIYALLKNPPCASENDMFQ